MLCLKIITELKKKYSFIKRVVYSCRNQGVILENEKDFWNKKFSTFFKKEINVDAYDEEYEHKTKETSNRAVYVERNIAMIDDSDFCVFYYNEQYIPPKRQQSKNSLLYQPKSGTKVAYKYALKKNKTIKNFYEKR